MPRKIDHQQYRLQLAQQATALFSKHGYSGLGMRKIAEELGISKSALYHYFPSKQALFHACTAIVTNFDNTPTPATQPQVKLLNANAKVADNIAELLRIIKGLEASFPSELSLLLDYLRGRSQQEIKDDATMQLANQGYEKLMRQFVAEQHSNPVLCLLMGTLLMRFLGGASISFDEIEHWLVAVLQKQDIS